MYRRILVFKCKVLIKLLRLLGKNGSALPGLIIEKLSPSFLEKSLKPYQKKIILVTGTNGKTTTTKMLVAGLRGAGDRVVTNNSGSNMTRGLIAALIEDMTYLGSIKPTDWFVFEMDEAYAPIFTKNISPKVVLALNVLRDQLDRYGEIDITARYIQKAAENADIFIYNSLDPLLVNVATELNKQGVSTSAFGISSKLGKYVANEQTVHGNDLKVETSNLVGKLTDVVDQQDGQSLTVACRSDGKEDTYQLTLPVKGFHNALNAVAATTVSSTLNPEKMLAQLQAISHMPIPFGRGEKLHMKNTSITVALVKNPSGFTSNLETFIEQMKPDAVLFVVNDRFADGRDVSWLWDVDFKSKIADDTVLYTSGIRAYDIALRLRHDGFESHSNTSVTRMIQLLMKSEYTNVVIIPTYTALFEVRTALSKYGKVPRIW